MITPYIDRDEEIEEVPKEVEVRRILVSYDESPYVRNKEKHSYRYREKTRHESRVVEPTCDVAKFLRACFPIFDRIHDRVRDHIEIKCRKEYLKKIDFHFVW